MSAQSGASGTPRRRARGGIALHAAMLACLLIAVWYCARPARAEARYPADAIKAAYLYRFAGYVTWPGPDQPSAPFTIAVIDDGSVASELKRLLPSHRINGHRARVRVIRRLADLGDARMLYVGDDYHGDLRAALASIGRRAILVVTDEDRGLDDGGTINFVEIGRRVRFEVSLTAAGRARLKISSELLSVAARVQGVHLRSRTDCAQNGLLGAWHAGCPTRVAALGDERPAERG